MTQQERFLLMSQFINIFEKIETLKTKFRNNKVIISFEYNTSKSYYTIKFQFEYCNSTYSGCVLFYDNEDYDYEKIISDIDTISQKAQTLLKH